MVEGAVRLLATRGVEGTSFAEVLEATGSPRGSVYHHFPGGKPELLHAALDLASERGLAAMEATRDNRQRSSSSAFSPSGEACWTGPISPPDAPWSPSRSPPTTTSLLDHAGTIFRTWTDLLTELCAAGGMDGDSARQLAVTVIAATEGAVALCRAERSMEPFEDVETVLLSLAKSMGAQ